MARLKMLVAFNMDCGVVCIPDLRMELRPVEPRMDVRDCLCTVGVCKMDRKSAFKKYDDFLLALSDIQL